MKIKLIVFDLDDTLLDTSRLLIPIANSPQFEKRIREPLPLMEGALENLQYLSDRYELALLTQGRTEAQMQKVTSMNIASFFKGQFYADPKLQQTKADLFREIRDNWSLQGSDILSIGNRRSTDIRSAKQIGAWTCLFRYGEHQDESPQCPEDHPDYEVTHHRELLHRCRL